MDVRLSRVYIRYIFFCFYFMNLGPLFIVLPLGRLRELILVSDLLQLRPLFGIS